PRRHPRPRDAPGRRPRPSPPRREAGDRLTGWACGAPGGVIQSGRLRPSSSRREPESVEARAGGGARGRGGLLRVGRTRALASTPAGSPTGSGAAGMLLGRSQGGGPMRRARLLFVVAAALAGCRGVEGRGASWRNENAPEYQPPPAASAPQPAPVEARG